MLPKDPSKVDEYKLKMSLAAKSKIGFKHSLETKIKISNSSIGKPKTEEMKAKMSAIKKELFKDKTKHPTYGLKMDENRKSFMRDVNLGENNHNFGKHFSLEHKRKIGENQRGEKNHSWKGGITSLKERIRDSYRYVDWRKSIFKRDNYKCKVCDINGKLEVHHIIRMPIILQKHNIKTVEDSEKCDVLWDISNGISLCRKCHINIHKKYKEND